MLREPFFLVNGLRYWGRNHSITGHLVPMFVSEKPYGHDVAFDISQNNLDGNKEFK